MSSAIDRLNNKITKGKKHDYNELQNVSVYAHNTTSNDFKSLLVDDDEHLQVKNNADNLGFFGNLLNNATLNSGNTSNSADIRVMNKGFILYEDTSLGSFDGVDIELSNNNNDFYLYQTFTPIPRPTTSKREMAIHLDLNGIKRLRLRNASLVDNYLDVKASIVGSA